MPVYPKFHEKLRLDNLYPTLPQKKISGNPLYEQFKRDLPTDGYEAPYPGQIIHTPNPEPSTKPMDVVFNQGNISETARGMNAARVAHDVDLRPNALSPYQYGQLANRSRDLDIRQQQYGNTNRLAQARVDETAEMGEFKRKNPGGEFVKQPDGNILYVGPGGQTLGNFGPSGIMAEDRKIQTNQENAIQRLDRGGEIAGAVEGRRQEGRMQLGNQGNLAAIALEAVKAGNRPVATNRNLDYTFGPDGTTVIGAKSRTEQVMPPKPAPGQGTTVSMYGPNGEGPYPIPTEQSDEAQEKYGMSFSPKKK